MFMPWWNISHFEDILRERKKKKNSLSSPVSMTKLISNFRTISSTDSHNNGSIKDKKKKPLNSLQPFTRRPPSVWHSDRYPVYLMGFINQWQTLSCRAPQQRLELCTLCLEHPPLTIILTAVFLILKYKQNKRKLVWGQVMISSEKRHSPTWECSLEKPRLWN